MRTITIQLPQHVAHRLEVSAARDDMRLADGIARLLTYLAERFEQAAPAHNTPVQEASKQEADNATL